MSNIEDMSQSDILYVSKDAANMLNIANTTVRKYCDELEKHGYEMKRNAHGHRLFGDQDMKVLEAVLKLKSEMKISEACKYVIKKLKVDINKESDISDMSQENTQIVPKQDPAIATTQMIESFKEMEAKLLDRIDQQTRLQERRDEQLMMVMREIAAAKEQKRKKPWWKFW
ncbi:MULTISPECIES: MerR family transcriptional regulator [Priestia]|uniref:MerR family transcriptional regulator n=1 Tax=Priestia TaxID=2800373 RepID=UPI0012B9DD9F|nr:MerR family transcriptional regulator [Priestia megaterium]